MPCFQGVNCAEACRQVSALGGALQDGPYSIPEARQWAKVGDPQAVAFGILDAQAPAPGDGRGDWKRGLREQRGPGEDTGMADRGFCLGVEIGCSKVSRLQHEGKRGIPEDIA